MTELDDGYDAPNPLVPNAGPHAAAGDEEEVYYEGSPLLRGEPLLLTVSALVALLLVAIGAAVIYYQGGLVWGPGTIAAAVLFVLAPLVLIFPALWVRRNRYRITNYRIDFEFGILTNNIETLELWHVNDIGFRQSLWDRVFRVGTIRITSDDRSTPELYLRSLPEPRPLFDTLKQRVISVKRQRGVIKMDMGG